MKTSDILNGIEALKILQTKKLPAKAAYRIVLFVKDVEKVLSSYNETRIGLLEKYGTKLENGSYEINDEEKLKEEMNEVLEEEVDIKNPEITLDMIEDIQIEPSILSSLSFIIKAE